MFGWPSMCKVDLVCPLVAVVGATQLVVVNATGLESGALGCIFGWSLDAPLWIRGAHV